MDDDQAMLSVAICTYNGERFLAEQLASIRRQSVTPHEVVICDDGSTDNTLGIVESFASQAPFQVQLLRNSTNLGSTKNFEKAISHCLGDIIFLADQDDVWREDKVEKVAEAFRLNPQAGFVFSNAGIVDGELRSLGFRLWDAVGLRRPADAESTFALDLFPETIRTFVVTGATMAIRKEFRDFVIPFSTEWVHDGWMATLLSGIRPAVAIDHDLIQYRLHGSQQLGLLKPIHQTWDILPTLRAGIQLLRRSLSKGNGRSNPTAPEMGEVQYQAILERLSDCSEVWNPVDNVLEARITLLKQKLEHLQRRTDIRKVLWRRPTRLIQEWRSGGYTQFSGGSLTALRDLIGL